MKIPNTFFKFILYSLILTVFPAVAVYPGQSQEIVLSKGQTVYVAVYSHIYSGDREHPFDLTTTLSIRNTDRNHSVTLVSVDYYDTDGKMLSNYLKSPLEVKPLASARYIIRESDRTGGSGAKFLVKWTSDIPVNMPLIESIMIGTKNQQGISFTSRGQVITEDKQ
ncbi:MAG: DUF3124 domain-containing protein [Desulfococcaceae bacterium]